MPYYLYEVNWRGKVDLLGVFETENEAIDESDLLDHKEAFYNDAYYEISDEWPGTQEELNIQLEELKRSQENGQD